MNGAIPSQPPPSVVVPELVVDLPALRGARFPRSGAFDEGASPDVDAEDGVSDDAAPAGFDDWDPGDLPRCSALDVELETDEPWPTGRSPDASALTLDRRNSIDLLSCGTAPTSLLVTPFYGIPALMARRALREVVDERTEAAKQAESYRDRVLARLTREFRDELLQSAQFESRFSVIERLEQAATHALHEVTLAEARCLERHSGATAELEAAQKNRLMQSTLVERLSLQAAERQREVEQAKQRYRDLFNEKRKFDAQSPLERMDSLGRIRNVEREALLQFAEISAAKKRLADAKQELALSRRKLDHLRTNEHQLQVDLQNLDEVQRLHLEYAHQEHLAAERRLVGARADLTREVLQHRAIPLSREQLTELWGLERDVRRKLTAMHEALVASHMIDETAILRGFVVGAVALIAAIMLLVWGL